MEVGQVCAGVCVYKFSRLVVVGVHNMFIHIIERTFSASHLQV